MILRKVKPPPTGWTTGMLCVRADEKLVTVNQSFYIINNNISGLCIFLF